MSSYHSRSLAVMLGLVVAACSGSGTPEGTWISDDGEGKLEFLKTGEIYMTGPDGTYAGDWEVIESGEVKVTFAGRGAALGDQLCAFEIKRKVLTLSGDCALEGTYRSASGA